MTFHLHVRTLGVSFCNDFLSDDEWVPKVACLMYQSLLGQGPAYLSDDINLVADSGRRLLRSVTYRT